MKISIQNAKRLITRFDNAVREHAFMGSKHPDDHAEIQYNYELARKALSTFCIEAVCDRI